MVHEALRLYIGANFYLLEPVYNDPSVQMVSLFVDRITGGLHLNVPAPPGSAHQEVLEIYGIMGFIRLQAGEYMIVITNKEKIGKISGHDIYRVTSFQILPLPNDLTSLSEKQTADEQTFISLLENHLKSNAFYYSYTYDITQALQRIHQLNSSHKLWQRADNRFFWNRFISSKMIDLTESYDQDLSNFILPVMQGFIEICPAHINNKNFVFILISRRNRFRAGTRFFSRGVDANGNVSNFVETEQLILYDPPRDGELLPKQIEGRIQLSYVQTRGSVPINWAQIINLKYTPTLKIMESSSIPTRKHFDEQLETYGPQVIVNLTNTSGYEVPVGQGFSRIVGQLNDPRLRYIHFDFHKECKNMQWHRINVLIEQIKGDLDRASYCRYDAVTRSHKTQQGAVRTNCMDCLDRTNVVQSTLARIILNKQLRDLNILSEREEIDEHPEFISLFRNVWADNADGVSLSYSGTGAMKTDFTRTGKRTRAGAFQDFVNGSTRYFKNNYFDGARQDAFDLILGNYQVTHGQPSPFATYTALHFRVVPLILIFALVMLAAGLLIPSAVGVSSEPSWFYVLFWIAVLVSTLRFVFQNGAEFVDWPKLVPLSFVSEKEKNGLTSFQISEKFLGGRKEDELERRERGEDIPLKKIT